MPIDPTYGVSLLSPQQPTSTNPLGFMQQMAELQNTMNRNQQFQYEMAGKQRAGQILATAPGSLEDRYMALLRDPLAAPFAAPIVNELRQADLAMVQAHGAVQEQARSGMNVVGQGMAAVYSDPTMNRQKFHDMMQARMSMLSPEARRADAFAVGQMEESLWGGISDNPTPEDLNTLRMRTSGLMVGMGITSPEAIRGLTGQVTPSVQEYTDPSGARRFAIVGGPAGGGTAVSPIDVSPTAQMGQPIGGPYGVTTTAPPPTPSPAPDTGAGYGGTAPPVGPPTALTPAAPAPAAPAATPSRAVNAAGQPLLPGEMATAPPQPPPSRAMVGPGLAQQEQIKNLAAGDNKMIENMADYSASGDMLAASRINAMLDALKQVKTGGFTTMGVEAGRYIIGLGRTMGWDAKFTKDMADQFAGGNLSEAQMLRHLLSNQAIQSLKEVAQGTGRVMRPEVEAAMKNLDLNMQPEAIWHILNDQAMPLVQMSYDMGAKWPQFRQAVLEGRMPGLRMADFTRWEQTRLSRQDRIQTTPDGIRVAPRGPEEEPDWYGAATPPPTPTPAPGPAPSPRGGPLKFAPPPR